MHRTCVLRAARDRRELLGAREPFDRERHLGAAPLMGFMRAWAPAPTPESSSPVWESISQAPDGAGGRRATRLTRVTRIGLWRAPRRRLLNSLCRYCGRLRGIRAARRQLRANPRPASTTPPTRPRVAAEVLPVFMSHLQVLWPKTC
jgi:hypothetical protein